MELSVQPKKIIVSRVAVAQRFHSGKEMVPEFEKLNIQVYPFQDFHELDQVAADRSFDCVIEINIHEAIVGWCHDHRVPYVCWAFDSGGHLPATLPFQASDFLFFYDKQDTDRVNRRGKTAYYLPFSAGSGFHRIPRTHSFREPILVVMNTYYQSVQQSERLYYETLAQCASGSEIRSQLEGLRRLAARVIESHKNCFVQNLIRQRLVNGLLREELTVLTDHPENLESFVAGLGQELAFHQRIQLVRTLANRFHVTVFGDDYWQAIATETPAIRYCGLASYEQLPDYYNGAEICINLTQPQCLNSIPQRVFHVLASGGFLLSSPSDVLLDLFEPGVHFETFSSLEELVEKCAFYLGHPEARNRIAQAGHVEFKRCHTMSHRLKFILERVRV